MENNIEGLKAGGIKCDNPKCDYVDDTVKMEEWEDYVNKPCPKCGENLFTEEDYNKTKTLINMIKVITELPQDQIDNMLMAQGLDPNHPDMNKQVKMSFNIHEDTLDIDIVNNKDEDEDE